jgi:hypothetical protein
MIWIAYIAAGLVFTYGINQAAFRNARQDRAPDAWVDRTTELVFILLWPLLLAVSAGMVAREFFKSWRKSSKGR